MYSRSHIEKSKIAILPVGSTEQHGPHLPVTTDSIIAGAVAGELLKHIPNTYVLPVLPYSLSTEHFGFPGTVSLKTVTLEAVIRDIVISLHKQNLPCIILNFHFGNIALGNFIQELNFEGYSVMLTPSRRILDKAYSNAGISKSPSQDMHAGEAETSLLLHICPDFVDLSKISDVDVPNRPLLNTLGFKEYTSTGVIGFPSLANPMKGKELLNSLTHLIAAEIKEFVYGS